jgi:eukaryotic-like serine/threonine-protein kinase
MDIASGAILASRYRVEKVVARGSTTTVYRARDLLLDEAVALKVLCAEARPEQHRRFRREVSLARRVTHPNVCRVFEHAEHDRPFFAMEYVAGGSLRRLLRGRVCLPAEDAYTIAVQVANALETIHACGLVHGNLTSANVLRDRSGRVKVIDFGLTRPVARASVSGRRPSGAPEYQSPERARGEPVDERSDLYSLGILLLEMLTGVPPFQGPTPLVTRMQQIHDRPSLASPRIPLRLVPVLEKALAKSAGDRYRSAGEMREALQEVQSASDIVPMEPGPQPWSLPCAPPGIVSDTAAIDGRRLRRAGGVAVASAAVLIGGWLAVRSLPDRPIAPQTPVAPEAPAAPSPRAGATFATPPAEPAAKTTARPTGRRTTPAPARKRPAAAETEPRSSSVESEAVEVFEPSVVPVPLDAAPEIRAEKTEAATSASGRLQIGIRPWASVSLDGVAIGETPLAPVALAPGIHTARIEHPSYRPLVRQITVRSGETVRLKVDLGLDGVLR